MSGDGLSTQLKLSVADSHKTAAYLAKLRAAVRDPTFSLELRIRAQMLLDAFIWRQRKLTVENATDLRAPLSSTELAKKNNERKRLDRLKAERLMQGLRPRINARLARQEAIKTGAITYMGNPCIHGHSGLRRTKKSDCVECQRLRGTRVG